MLGRARLLIIGNGMASLRLVETLLAKAPDRFAITIIGGEAEPAYNRVLLSSLLANECSKDDVTLRPRSWYQAHDIDLCCDEWVSQIDLGAKCAHTVSGKQIDFDILVLATGSDPIRLPLPGADLPGVMAFRDLRDVAMMQAGAHHRAHVAVIGGGLLGIEAASGLAHQGAKVTLIHVMDRLMERQLDSGGAAFLLKALRKRGIAVRLQSHSVAIEGDTRVRALHLADGSSIEAALVVMAAGIRPRSDLAKDAGLAVGRGILVNDHLETSAPHIFALGECAEHRGVVHGLVEPAYAQADVLAAHLAGEEAAFTGMTPATNLKVSGVPVFSAGDFLGAEGTVTAISEDHGLGLYRKLVFQGTHLVGCVLVGDSQDGLWFRDLIRSRTDISAMRRDLIHGRAFVAPEAA